jgi:anti-anti-sigma factor
MNPVIVRLCGDIDLASRTATDDALAHAVTCARAQAAPVVVDLSEVTFLDSTGMSCLVVASRALKPDQRLYLRGPQPIARRALEIAGLGSMICEAPPACRPEEG